MYSVFFTVHRSYFIFCCGCTVPYSVVFTVYRSFVEKTTSMFFFLSVCWHEHKHSLHSVRQPPLPAPPPPAPTRKTRLLWPQLLPIYNPQVQTSTLEPSFLSPTRSPLRDVSAGAKCLLHYNNRKTWISPPSPPPSIMFPPSLAASL